MARSVTGVHHAGARDAGATLVELLAARAVPGGDYTVANQLVRDRRVQVNGNLVQDPSRQVRAGDVVKVLAHATTGPASAGDVQIVFADEHLVIVNKPPGVTTLREPGDSQGRRNRQATLDVLVGQALRRRESTGQGGGARKRITSGRGDGSGVRGGARHSGHGAASASVIPVHRLDRDTSGLMVFARSSAAERTLLGLFKGKQVERNYLAVVHGHPAAQKITTHIVRDRGDGLRGSAELWGKDPAAGQRAVTYVEPLEAIGPYALVRLALETGRTHQIRIHLSERGHMLCGEKQYTRLPDGTRQRDDSGAPRQALHAGHLALVHPISGRGLRFSSRFPPDLSTWLDRLRRGDQ